MAAALGLAPAAAPSVAGGVSAAPTALPDMLSWGGPILEETLPEAITAIGGGSVGAGMGLGAEGIFDATEAFGAGGFGLEALAGEAGLGAFEAGIGGLEALAGEAGLGAAEAGLGAGAIAGTGAAGLAGSLMNMLPMAAIFGLGQILGVPTAPTYTPTVRESIGLPGEGGTVQDALSALQSPFSLSSRTRFGAQPMDEKSEFAPERQRISDLYAGLTPQQLGASINFPETTSRGTVSGGDFGITGGNITPQDIGELYETALSQATGRPLSPVFTGRQQDVTTEDQIMKMLDRGDQSPEEVAETLGLFGNFKLPLRPDLLTLRQSLEKQLDRSRQY